VLCEEVFDKFLLFVGVEGVLVYDGLDFCFDVGFVIQVRFFGKGASGAWQFEGLKQSHTVCGLYLAGGTS
jgi:hypothetical protein